MKLAHGHKKAASSCLKKTKNKNKQTKTKQQTNKKQKKKQKEKKKQGPGVVFPQYMAPGSFWRKGFKLAICLYLIGCS